MRNIITHKEDFSIKEKITGDEPISVINKLPLQEEEKKALRQLNYVYNSTQKIWSVAKGDTLYIMTVLNLNRKKADDLIMKVLNVLDKDFKESIQDAHNIDNIQKFIQQHYKKELNNLKTVLDYLRKTNVPEELIKQALSKLNLKEAWTTEPRKKKIIEKYESLKGKRIKVSGIKKTPRKVELTVRWVSLYPYKTDESVVGANAAVSFSFTYEDMDKYSELKYINDQTGEYRIWNSDMILKDLKNQLVLTLPNVTFLRGYINWDRERIVDYFVEMKINLKEGYKIGDEVETIMGDGKVIDVNGNNLKIEINGKIVTYNTLDVSKLTERLNKLLTKKENKTPATLYRFRKKDNYVIDKNGEDFIPEVSSYLYDQYDKKGDVVIYDDDKVLEVIILDTDKKGLNEINRIISKFNLKYTKQKTYWKENCSSNTKLTERLNKLLTKKEGLDLDENKIERELSSQLRGFKITNNPKAKDSFDSVIAYYDEDDFKLELSIYHNIKNSDELENKQPANISSQLKQKVTEVCSKYGKIKNIKHNFSELTSDGDKLQNDFEVHYIASKKENFKVGDKVKIIRTTKYNDRIGKITWIDTGLVAVDFIDGLSPKYNLFDLNQVVKI